MTAAAYALCHIFSGRGAYIHVGAMLGTVMVANVLMVIIPNQKKVVAALLAGRKPEPLLGIQAKQRSVHNNYMTLPVLLVMISNHYAMLYGGPYNWLTLAGLAAADGIVAYVGDDLKSYGNLVLIRHGVGRGMVLRRGQVIGTVGSTGTVPVSQLHFEIRHGSKTCDPKQYLG